MQGMPLLILVDNIIQALDSGEVAVGVFLDFSKAFDTVNHKILLSKLYHYGIRENAYTWLTSYLSNRTQYVSYNGSKSTERIITCGVPQGSILGPLLFLIYINDLTKVCHFAKPFLFADDTNLLHHNKDPQILENELNIDLFQPLSACKQLFQLKSVVSEIICWLISDAKTEINA